MEIQRLKETLSVIKEGILRPRYAVPFLVIISSFIRMLPLRFKYLLGYDPYFHLAYIEYSIRHGEWVKFFPYTYAPYGSLIRGPIGFWMAPAYFYKFLSIFGLSLFNSFRITPVVFGVLTVVLLYFSMLLLYGEREALASAFFLSVMFGHVFRSMAGYYRGDNYMMFWYALSLFAIAIAISIKQKKLRYKRLIFYVIPAFASGLSAIFWQSYYPIFGFLLANAIGLGLGAFILKRDRYIIDSVALTVSLAGGALLANYLGAKYGYGMMAVSWGLGKWIAKEFGLQSEIIKDTFLLFYLKFLIPITIVALLFLMILSILVKRKILRVAVIAAYLALFLIVGLRYYGTLEAIVLRFFPTSPIAETQRTSFRDLWNAYGLALFLTPSFFMIFVSKRKNIGNFLLLGLVVVTIPMLFLWTRFLFIGAFSIAFMAGIAIVQLYEIFNAYTLSKKFWGVLVISLLLAFPLGVALQGFQNTVEIKPFVNENWEGALSHLKTISHINDVVLDWWDHGYWIIYYAQRPVIAQAGPNKMVAEYYLGLISEEELMKRGVDFVIVSYDLLLKFDSVLTTANVSGSDFGYILLWQQQAYGNVLMFSNGPYTLIAIPRKDSWDVKVDLGNTIVTPREVFVETSDRLMNVTLINAPTANIYVYLNLNYGYAVVMNEKAFDTPLARLMFTNNYSDKYRLVYSDGGFVKIFKFYHPNVAVMKTNSSIVLCFTNSTGTVLIVGGHLNNGTLVFKGRYDVTGKERFILPENLNGSVVVRYIYSREKIVLDRGVFRIDDVISES